MADAPGTGPDIKEILLKRSVRRSVLGAAGIAAVLATAIIWPFDAQVTSGASLAFEARFGTSD